MSATGQGMREPAEGCDPEPLRATIADVDVVTIPLAHYAELLQARRLVAENDLRRRPTMGGTGRIDRDPEVATFLIENLPGRSLKELCALALARFGPSRAPSRSSIQRFRDRLRSGG